VSPKRRVAIVTGIFAALGVGVSLAIIAAGGGFTTGASILNPPGKEDIWQVGKNIQDGTMLEYSLNAKGPSSSLDSATVTMNFREAGDDWNVTFTIVNGTGEIVNRTIAMSKELTRQGKLDDSFVPYFEAIQSSVFAVRDMDYGGRDKYLVVGAPWDTIFVGASSVTVKVTGRETVQTEAGSFDSFVLSYSLDDKTSKIWMVSYMPLPVKAEVFDGKDQQLYSFELQKMSGIKNAGRAL
jgi:hypothetical protein